MVLVQKWHFFQLFFFKAIWAREMFFYDILEQKNAFLSYKNKKFKKLKNWHFSKGVTHGFNPKWPFFQLFFLGNIGQQNVFYDILEQKNGFLGYINKKFKQSKNWHISKGVNPSFWSKNGHYSKNCSLGNIPQENIFYDILERENAFLGYKNKKIKKSKNWYFSKWVKGGLT